MITEPQWIEQEDELATLYGTPRRTSKVKVSRTITDNYAKWIKASPFCALASVGPEGLDCSPRGDDGTVVDIVDEKTLALPDRRGNNRIDTLRNIVRDPRVALMFLIPGSGTVIRVNGIARITADPAWLDHYAREGHPPRSVVVVKVSEVYFQCARAVMRSKIWSGDHQGLDALPSVGTILEDMDRIATANEGASDEPPIDGAWYDTEWPKRAKESLW